MLKTHYVKRAQIHRSKRWGLQQSCVETQLLRAHCGNGDLPVIWEWVATGNRLSRAELERIMDIYPVCIFQTDDDLMWRFRRDAAKRQT